MSNYQENGIEQFNKVYFQTFREIEKYLTKDTLVHISKHCYSWHPDQFDMKNYLRLSYKRFGLSFKYIEQNYSKKDNILDIGGFWGVFPVTLKRMGYNISITEKYEYYADHFDKVMNFIERNGVKIYDCDPVEEEFNQDSFRLITCLALLEHLPHSPAKLMRNIWNALAPNGGCIIEVPNIACLSKRIDMVQGKTVLPHIQTVMKSAVPFIGHHHEYTVDELRFLCKESGFTIKDMVGHNYSQKNEGFISRIITFPIQLREVLIAYAIKKE